MEFGEQFEAYRSNMFEGMWHKLADEFGVSIETIQEIGAGFYPAEQAWVLPERDAKGNIVGLIKRSVSSGKKWAFEKSKRGLVYAFNNDYCSGKERYYPGSHNWTRATEECPCPVCGKPDWCLVSADNPQDPSAVICPRTAENATKYLDKAGYLHILKENKRYKGSSVLPNRDAPVLVVEGFSDTCVAHELGFIAVGRASALGGSSELKSLPLSGRTIYILGENDDGAGEDGMNKTFLALREMSENVIRAMPPKGVKDLRDWHDQLKVTQEEMIEYFQTAGKSGGIEDVFEDNAPLTLAGRFLSEKKFYDGVVTLRNYKGQWVEWNSSSYEDVNMPMLRGQLYRYLDGKYYVQQTAKGEDMVPIVATKRKLNDIIDACNARCAVNEDPPVWFGNDEKDFTRLIAFKNGILDLNDYFKGRLTLDRPTPKLFTHNAIPYDFDEDAKFPEWHETMQEIFNGDEDSIRLLHQWMGYQLIPDTSYEKFMMFIGPPRSGKGTIIESIIGMLSQKNCATTTLQSMGQNFGYQKLMNKMAVFLPDAKAPDIHKTPYLIERMLQVTGGDPVNINRKFLTELAGIHLKCRFTLAVNEIPELPDSTTALISRLLPIQFPNSYVGHEDTQLKKRLKRKAAKGKLVNIALQGLKDLVNNGGFVIPEASKDVLRNFREVNNPVWAFINECCKYGNGIDELIPCHMFYDAWRAWCKSENKRPGARSKLRKKVEAAVPGVKIVRKRFAKKNVDLAVKYGDSEGKVECYKGIILKDWIKDLMV